MNAPSDLLKLLAVSQDTVGTAAEDLATFQDITPFDYIVLSLVLTGTVTASSVTLKFVTSDASNGSSPVTAKDAAGADISAVIATPANGTAIQLVIRNRGLKKFGSPQISTGGAACDVTCVMNGFGVRDTKEISSHWTGGAGAAVTETAFS